MPDYVRESLFNLLRGHFEGERIVDAFAGVGANGLEALSRGAASCVFIEKSKETGRVLRANIDAMRVGDRAELLLTDALGNSALGAVPDSTHLIFFDPPYAMIEDGEQRSRCLAQLARFIQKLDDTGYAILRTPWPIRSKKAKGEEDDQAPIDLTLPGALGPETHEHGTMAIHLYMRDPNQPAAADTAPDEGA